MIKLWWQIQSEKENLKRQQFLTDWVYKLLASVDIKLCFMLGFYWTMLHIHVEHKCRCRCRWKHIHRKSAKSLTHTVVKFWKQIINNLRFLFRIECVAASSRWISPWTVKKKTSNSVYWLFWPYCFRRRLKLSVSSVKPKNAILFSRCRPARGFTMQTLIHACTLLCDSNVYCYQN